MTVEPDAYRWIERVLVALAFYGSRLTERLIKRTKVDREMRAVRHAIETLTEQVSSAQRKLGRMESKGMLMPEVVPRGLSETTYTGPSPLKKP